MYVYNNTSTKKIGSHAKERFMRHKIHLYGLYIGMVAFNQFSFQDHVSVMLSFAALFEANHC